MSKKPTPKAKSTGKRYSQTERNKILGHVKGVNGTRGRGGVAAAVRKFGVSALTINKWLQAVEPGAPSKRPGRPPGRPAGRPPGRPAGRPAGRPKSNTASNTAKTLKRLAHLDGQITKHETELISLRKEFKQLKNTL